jgi:transposase
MLYLAIDLHSRQLTVSLRDEAGDILLRRQVSTEWAKVRAFLTEVRELATQYGGFCAIVEVCGFEDWLLKLLREYGCMCTVLVQSKERAKRKTDRIDANKLGEQLWMNRFRLAAGQRLQQLRQIEPPSEEDAAARQITMVRVRMGRERTRMLNQIQRLLRKHNLSQECPTKSVRTQPAREWLGTIPLPAMDRLEMNLLLDRWKLWDKHVVKIDAELQRLQKTHRVAQLLSTIPGLGDYSSLAIACRIGSIERFAKPSSLANFWGLVPSCRNSGETKQRLGSITKEGSTVVRFLLGQAVYHVLRKCPRWRTWYKQLKARRGSKIARVAVMRRLAISIWHIVKHNVPFDAEAGFRANSAKTKCPSKSTRSSAGEGTSRPPSSLPPHPQPPSPLLCSSAEEA